MKNLALTLLFIFTSSYVQAQEMTFKNHGKVLKTLNLIQMEKLSPSQIVTVDDPNEKTKIKFRAIALNALLNEIYGRSWAKDEEMLFTCLDGYQPSLPVAQFISSEGEGEAFLAFERIGSKNLIIENKTEGGKKIAAGPFYLVWNKSVDGSSWPYQLTTFDLTTFIEHSPKLAPPENSSAKAKRGFLAFRKNCALCHAMNGDGAHIGPELNYPVNVTEYYKISFLKKWIDNPASIRLRSHMPALHSDIANRTETIDEIVAYLQSMVHRKIKP